MEAVLALVAYSELPSVIVVMYTRHPWLTTVYGIWNGNGTGFTPCRRLYNPVASYI